MIFIAPVLPSQSLFDFSAALEPAALGLFDLPQGPDLTAFNRSYRAALMIVEALHAALTKDNGASLQKTEAGRTKEPSVKPHPKKEKRRRAETVTEAIQKAYAKALLDLSTRGTAVPTEAQLADRFDCNPSTVSRAISRYKKFAKAVMKEDSEDDCDRLGYDEHATRNRVLRNTPKKSSL